MFGFPRQGIALDARAVKDATTHDGETFCPHVKKLFETYPEIRPLIKRVLYDSACDRSKIKKKFENNLGLELRVSFNPRRKQEISVNLPRCIEKNYAGMIFLYVKQDTGRISLYTPLAGDLPLISTFFQPIQPCLLLPYLLLQ